MVDCLACVDAEGQAAVRAALLDDHHEPAEHGQRALGAGRRRLHACPHPCPDHVRCLVAHVQRPVCQRLLREATDRRGTVLVDAVRLGNRVYQDDGLRRVVVLSCRSVSSKDLGIIYRVAACLENLKMSGNLTAVGDSPKIRDL